MPKAFSGRGMPPPKTASRRTQLNRGFAKALRACPTDSEQKLWRLLRRKQIAAMRFRPQQPIGPYIVDFLCPAAKLIVELDGDQHGADKNVAYDTARTRWLEARGYKVLRFTNSDAVKADTLDAIWREVEGRLPLPERPAAVPPSLKGRVE